MKRHVDVQMSQVTTCLMLTLQQLYFNEQHPSKPIKFPDLQEFYTFLFSALEESSSPEHRVILMQILSLVITHKATSKIKAQDEWFRRAVVTFLKRAQLSFEKSDLIDLEGGLIFMLYFQCIKLWGEVAATSLWSDEDELNEFIRVCNSKRYQRRYQMALL
jgi:hypothetical protein